MLVTTSKTQHNADNGGWGDNTHKCWLLTGRQQQQQKICEKNTHSS
ncbi:hypothetical protein DOY81_002147 [Sarcophaga bullata]|nr:hypothetical protein DOY81_002147 [Sarcophaga bullata]